MKCPECGGPTPDGAVECPSCGVIFAKLKEKRENALLAAKRFLAASVEASEPPSPWLGRAIAGALAAAWLGVMGYFCARAWRDNRARRAAPPPDAPSAPSSRPPNARVL